MTDPDVGPPAPAVEPELRVAERASDRERQAVVDHLQTATSEGRLTLEEFEERVGHVLAARTRDELAPVTADLPISAGWVSRVGPEASPGGEPITEPRRRMISVFSSAHHAGPWEAGRKMTVVAVFGHSHVDLAAGRLPPGVDSVELRTIGVFAGIELVAPPGAVVDVGGFSLFGGRHLRHSPAAQTMAGLRVRVRSYGAFGGLLVRSARRVP